MELWFLILVAFSISALIRAILNLFSPYKNPAYTLPPGPRVIPVIGDLKWMGKSLYELQMIIRSLQPKLGPIITLFFGSRPTIFITDRSLAHQALVEKGTVFSSRPPPNAIDEIATSNHSMITTSSYGHTWRILRRNLKSEMLHPCRVKSYSGTRKSVLKMLLHRFESQQNTDGLVSIGNHCEYGLLCLLVRMCFGDDLDEKQILEIEKAENSITVIRWRYEVLKYFPNLTKILFRKSWSEIKQIFKARADIMIPLIRRRKKLMEDNEEFVVSYVDTLLNLQLPHEKRKLTEFEIVSLCSEFLHVSTETTPIALQWIMANLVKYPNIQQKLFMEIKQVHQVGEAEVKEEEVQKMPYLKAVILEALRRHAPGHISLPYSATEDAVLGNYLVPKNAIIYFMFADMGWDPKVWEDPMAFKPERFIGKEVDITGSKEITMLPFGAGRRICPGYGFAMLHLEYFVANLVWNYEFKAVNDEDVDLSQKQEFTVASMKNPLQAHISRRLI
ncbi:Cytochrome P450 superfamily protein [Euphorbia peplus]|nr:Cytochrome P450 superfamily protein [Euphorbia peplus]